MNNDERELKRFGGIIAALAATFGQVADEAMLEGYQMALDDLPLEAIERAARAAMRQCKFMPRAIELRELTGDMATTSRAIHAWSAVQKAIGQHGAYASVSFDDPVINATVRNLGGWQKLCQTNTEEFEKWTRKDFERIYGALVASGIGEEQAKYLHGIHEQNNTALVGHALPPPKLIATGLPPHREGVVRQIAATSEPGRDGRVSLLVAGIAEERGVA